jgi:UDP-glucose 6-dehydrogenase
MANLCEIVDADIETVAYGMGLDSRIEINSCARE